MKRSNSLKSEKELIYDCVWGVIDTECFGGIFSTFLLSFILQLASLDHPSWGEFAKASCLGRKNFPQIHFLFFKEEREKKKNTHTQKAYKSYYLNILLFKTFPADVYVENVLELLH